jgi:hypothetical protein
MSLNQKLKIAYYCRACPEVFYDAATSNAHHDATGHHQTWKPEGRYTAPVSPPSGSAEDSGVSASGEDREVTPAPCASVSQKQVQETRDASVCGTFGHPTVTASRDLCPHCTKPLAEHTPSPLGLRCPSTPAPVASQRALVADIARVAHWLMNDSGYTKRHAAARLADIARKYNADAWDSEDFKTLLGDAASLPRTVNLSPREVPNV